MANIASPAGWKSRTRTVTDDQSVLCYVKWNPDQKYIANGTTVATAAQMQVQANQVNFTLNTVADTEIGTYSGNSGGDDAIVFTDAASVGALINYINGLELGIDRYIAGLGDFRPGFTIGAGDGLAVAATNIMLGRGVQGLPAYADSSGLAVANTFSVGCGTRGVVEGRGQEFPDVREYEYSSTVAGVVTKVRNPNLSRERTYTSQLRVKVTEVHYGMAYATNAKVVSFYDQNNNLLLQRAAGSTTDFANADRYNFENPIVEAVGPIFVEVVGTGNLTDGPLSVTYFEHVA